MRLSPQEEYGLRCLIQVARHAPDPGGPPVSIERIAEAEGLGYEHAAKILRLLRRAQLVTSTRGVHGGYHLARPADAIPVWEALVGLDNPLYDSAFCDAFAGQQPACSHATTACALRVLWHHVGSTLQDSLSQITVADLLAGRAPARNPAPAPHPLLQGSR